VRSRPGIRSRPIAFPQLCSARHRRDPAPAETNPDPAKQPGARVALAHAVRYGIAVITAKQIRELMQARPFKPFRIGLSDGTHYDVTNHDMAFVTKNTVEVGVNLDAEGFAECVARCSILHITRLEDLPQPIPATGSAG
jgi:hypothetical protein